MCVIIIGGKSRPTRSMLSQCEDANRDGAGIAWIHTNGRVRFVKGLNARGVAEVLERIVPKGAEFVIHFRLATAGGSLPELTHPFIVSDRSELFLEGEADRVLFHNGHESRFETLRAEAKKETGRCLDGPVSDSRVVARIAHLAGLDILDRMSGKYVVLGGGGIEIMSPKIGLVLNGQTGYGAGTGWTLHCGLWFSNLHWMGRTSWITTASKSAAVSFRGSRPDVETPTVAPVTPVDTLRSAQLELGWSQDEVEVGDAALESELTRILEREREFEENVIAVRADAAAAEAARKAQAEANARPKGKKGAKPKRQRVTRSGRRSETKTEEPKWTYTPPSVARDMSVVPANPDKPRNLRQEK